MTNNETTDFTSLLASPKPLELLLKELLAALRITQKELAASSDLDPAFISKLINRKTTASPTSLSKLHYAFTEVYDVPSDILTFDYLVACQDVNAEDKLSPRVSHLNEWLSKQPKAVQNGFWEQAEAFIRTIESLRNRDKSS